MGVAVPMRNTFSNANAARPSAMAKDRAYTDFGFMNGLDARGVWFVTCQKRKMKMEVVRRLMEPVAATGERKTQILADEIVVPAKKTTAAKYAGTLRRVTAVVEIQGQMKVMRSSTSRLPQWDSRRREMPARSGEFDIDLKNIF